MAHKCRFSLLLHVLPAHRGAWSAERNGGCRASGALSLAGKGQLCSQGGARGGTTRRLRASGLSALRSSEGRQTRKEVPLPDSGQCRRELPKTCVWGAAGQGDGPGAGPMAAWGTRMGARGSGLGGARPRSTPSNAPPRRRRRRC